MKRKGTVPERTGPAGEITTRPCPLASPGETNRRGLRRATTRTNRWIRLLLDRPQMPILARLSPTSACGRRNRTLLARNERPCPEQMYNPDYLTNPRVRRFG